MVGEAWLGESTVRVKSGTKNAASAITNCTSDVTPRTNFVRGSRASDFIVTSSNYQDLVRRILRAAGYWLVYKVESPHALRARYPWFMMSPLRFQPPRPANTRQVKQ